MHAHADLKETKHFTITESEFYENSFTCILICKQTQSVRVFWCVNKSHPKWDQLKRWQIKKKRNKLHYWTDKLKFNNKNSKAKRY